MKSLFAKYLIKDYDAELKLVLEKLTPYNIEKLCKYSKMLLNVQESTEKKERNAYNHRRHSVLVDGKEKWEYMTKDIIETHKTNTDKTFKKPQYDIVYRSRYCDIKIIDTYDYIHIFGKNHNKIIVADYLMFNPHFMLDYNLVDRLLNYCKIHIIDDYTYNIDGWTYELNMYGNPNYKITYDNSKYNEDKFITTEEEKRLAVRLFIQVMNETPEEYVNMNNYNVIAEWYYNNDSYINSYNSNMSLYNIYKKNLEVESTILKDNELVLDIDDKLMEKELVDTLSQNSKYGGNDIYEMGLDSKPDIDISKVVDINTKQLNLVEFYKQNGYVNTKAVIDSIKYRTNSRLNCDNYPKENGEKLTKIELVAGLYNSCMPFGMGIMQSDDKKMSLTEAENIMNKTDYIDYYKGTPFKMHFGEFPIIDFERFEKYNGKGKFMECIKQIQSNTITDKVKLTPNHVVNEIIRMATPLFKK